MLERIEVRDFALIEHADVEFSGGFTTFTGETGAGKSLVVGAIGFLFGARADVDIIRRGASECSVSGLLDISRSPGALEWIDRHGMDAEDRRVILRRGLKANGRSYAWLAGQAVTRADLAAFTAFVCDIHGQHEHQGLLKPESHLGLLDGFAGLEGDCSAYASLYAKWAEDAKRYREAVAEEQKMAREREFLRFSVEELKKAHLVRGEDEELAAEEKALAHHEKLFSQVDTASTALGGTEEGAALSSLRKAKSALEGAASIDERVRDLAGRLGDAFFEIEDIASALHDYSGRLRFDPARLEEIESRQAELRRLKRKYGASVGEMITRLEVDERRLAQSENWESERQDLEKAIRESGRAAQAAALALSAGRKLAAAQFGMKVEHALSGLGMPKAKFIIGVSERKDSGGALQPGPDGVDSVEFLIAPNPGEPAKPLAKIASGGELSRVALAVKTVLSAKDTVGTLIFDEVDAGIGGEVALSVGRRLKELADSHQVLCVTHLASIAAMADAQFGVGKELHEGRTQTRIQVLEGRAREEEIARMLAGDPDGSESLAHAAALLEKHQVRARR